MGLIDKIKSTLLSSGSLITGSIKDELKDQGHYNTGKLYNSVQHFVSKDGNNLSLDISMLDYHVYVEYGVKANRIPFGGKRTGKKTSRYITGLIEFFKNKGLSDKEAKGAAFATAHVHKREGMPSKGSYAHSSNTRRLFFINESTMASKEIDEIETQIQDDMEEEGSLILNEFEKAIS